MLLLENARGESVGRVAVEDRDDRLGNNGAGVQVLVHEMHCAAAELHAMLSMDARQPCLVLKRQTQSAGKVASIATMWHPGHRYQFAGSFA